MGDLTVEAVLLDTEAIELPTLARLYDYWRGLCRGRFAPSRADIDPTELGFILPRLLMFDVLDGGDDFRVRLAGSGTFNLHGRDITGMLVSNFTPAAFREAVASSYRQIVRDRLPVYVRNTYWRNGIEVDAYHVLRLPLSSDGENVNIILVGEDYRGREADLVKIMETD
ncbi:PAS domain-containing protein [Dongia soli]|uniref:PAS domain-containing protein n=1 Tax=Dongia soli TaxID=600628 RepID=A0ABU5EAV0_9PROT|nr:PAS domain-containing protein [Dongia soli]MDY0882924.1 PAS domain-containing protein [Dongia soli]